MKLSLLIPVYNGGDYWRECWDSVLRNQDFFEQIFVSIPKDMFSFFVTTIFCCVKVC